jgi:hypothetical protein
VEFIEFHDGYVGIPLPSYHILNKMFDFILSLGIFAFETRSCKGHAAHLGDRYL